MNIKSLLYIIPTVLFAGFMWMAVGGLGQDKQGQPLVSNAGKTMPFSALPMLDSTQIFTQSSVKGQKVLINFFASWCKPCLEEQDYLKALHDALTIPIIGIVYKDKEAAVRSYLKEHGNPYAGVALDNDGRAAIDWGVTGVPETFLVDGDGTILAHASGPLSIDVWNKFFKSHVQGNVRMDKTAADKAEPPTTETEKPEVKNPAPEDVAPPPPSKAPLKHKAKKPSAVKPSSVEPSAVKPSDEQAPE